MAGLFLFTLIHLLVFSAPMYAFFQFRKLLTSLWQSGFLFSQLIFQIVLKEFTVQIVQMFFCIVSCLNTQPVWIKTLILNLRKPDCEQWKSRTHSLFFFQSIQNTAIFQNFQITADFTQILLFQFLTQNEVNHTAEYIPNS